MRGKIKIMTVTVTEVSTALGEDPQRIRVAARDQHLPTIRRPGSPKARYHFRIEDVIEYARKSGYNDHELENITTQLEAALERKNKEPEQEN